MLADALIKRFHTINKQSLLPDICRFAEEAGSLIMTKYFEKQLHIEQKPGEGPVTEADKEADSYIVEKLKELTPGVPIVSEEGKPKPNVAGKHMYWLVDALDGTKSFIQNGKNWTVNIALIVDGKPQFGVVYAPAHGVMYAGDVGIGAFRMRSGESVEQIHTRPVPEDGATVILSHHHKSDDILAMLPKGTKVKDSINASSSIKFCKIAEGAADIYPRSGPTMEWDTAAGQAVLEAAGGVMLDEQSNLFRYGKSGFKNGPFSVYGKAPELGVGTAYMHAGDKKRGKQI